MKKSYLLSIVALCFTGCVPISGTGEKILDGIFPEVSFSHLEIEEIDFEHVDSSFVFVVDNPNPVGFSIDRFNYALDFSEVEWLSGDNPDGLQVMKGITALP